MVMIHEIVISTMALICLLIYIYKTTEEKDDGET